MVGEWTENLLGNLVEIKHGFAFGGEHFRDEPPGNILLTPGNFAIGGGFKADKFKYYDGPVPDEFVLSEGDLLVTMTDLSKEADTLGYPAFVPAPTGGRRYLHNQRLGKVIVKDEKAIDLRYLNYLLCSKDYRHEVLASATGTTVKHTSPERLKRFCFMRPPLPEQRAIAHILGTLDDKIERNRRMNETLEGFVDFDPVRANVEGHDSGLPKALADLFPDSFDDSERGAIPKGWQRGTIGALATLSRKSVIPGDFPNEVFDHYSIPAYDNGCMPKQETGELIKSNKFLLLPECVLLSKLNPRIPRIWMPNVKAGRRSVCSTEYLVVLPKPDVPRVFLYCLFSNNAFVSEFATFVTGTSGSHQRVKPENLLQMSCIIAPEPVVNRVASIVKPILERVSGNIAQSCTLAVLRDTLLPRLLSGKIRVKNAKRISGESTFGNLPRVLKPHISSARTPADKGEDV